MGATHQMDFGQQHRYLLIVHRDCPAIAPFQPFRSADLARRFFLHLRDGAAAADLSQPWGDDRLQVRSFWYPDANEVRVKRGIVR